MYKFSTFQKLRIQVKDLLTFPNNFILKGTKESKRTETTYLHTHEEALPN